MRCGVLFGTCRQDRRRRTEQSTMSPNSAPTLFQSIFSGQTLVEIANDWTASIRYHLFRDTSDHTFRFAVILKVPGGIYFLNSAALDRPDINTMTMQCYLHGI